MERSCEALSADAVFVGRVIQTTSTKHYKDKDTWSPGYSMRVAIQEQLAGDLGTEITIETGSGAGDCGTPLSEGQTYLVFASKGEDGNLWIGACGGTRQLPNDSDADRLIDQYRTLLKHGKSGLFGRVTFAKPVWRDDEVDDESHVKPLGGLILRAKSRGYTDSSKTQKDGSYEFVDLPPGQYEIRPDIGNLLDFDHEYDERYRANLRSGECVRIDFKLEPSTRIRGVVVSPPGQTAKELMVEAIPIHLKGLDQFSGQREIADEDGHFDLWPLPPGDYYVGVNINSSPSAEAPYPPTYYPGVTKQKAASIVHVDENEIKTLTIPLSEVANPRPVHFVAVGLDGKPLRKIYIQLEDLRHPGDASSYVNVDLDEKGAGVLTVFSGYSYHLHGSHWVSYGNDWCAKPVEISAGTRPVDDVKFLMDHSAGNCDLSEIDRRGK